MEVNRKEPELISKRERKETTHMEEKGILDVPVVESAESR
jgi:hypothetical protein